MITKRQIADSVVEFISNDLMQRVGDGSAKFVLCMAKQSLKESDTMIDRFLSSPLIASVVKRDGNEYDVDDLAMIMRNVLENPYTITIPKVPVFAPHETVVKITASDLDRLLGYMNDEPEPASIV